ncbi:MAG: AAA family ATPase [Anaerolineales bacterium]
MRSTITTLQKKRNGVGGALDQVDQATAKSSSKNSYTAWGSITPLHNKLADAMLQSPCHIVGTMRSKMEYEQVDDNGKKKINKIGLAPIQRAGMEYEFTAVCDVDVDHRLIVSKSRFAEWADRQVVKPDVKFFMELSDWLNGGAVRTPKPVIATSAPVAAVDPSWTFANLLKTATKKYKITEAHVRATLKAANITEFTPDKFIACMSTIDMAYS